MELSVRKTIKEFGLSPLANASGIPYSTLYRWRELDKIPGKGPQHAWRVNEFVRAVEKLRAEAA